MATGASAGAVSDMALARSDNNPQRFYSMSSQIRRERRAYYDVLERTQRETVDVTAWDGVVCGLFGALDRKRRGDIGRYAA